MAYTIVNKFISQALYKLKAPYAMTPEYVTIHNTYNDATALNEISYMTGNDSVVGYHVAIDDKYAVQAIPFSRNAFHAGDGKNGTGNRKSISIEICYSKNGGDRYYAAEENAVIYTAHVLKQYGWGINRIKWHRDWSGKNCPHRMISEGRLGSFKQRVQRKLDELNGKATPIKPDNEGVDIMSQPFKPTSHAISQAVQDVIYSQSKKEWREGTPYVSDDWRKKFIAGDMDISDAIGLIYVMINRGAIELGNKDAKQLK